MFRLRADTVSVWLLSGAGSCALVVVAWTIASFMPTSQPPSRASMEVPIRVTFAAALPANEGEAGEPSWDADSVSIPVELDVALAARSDDATPLPFEHEPDGARLRRSGRFYLRPPNGVDIVVGRSNGFSGDCIELRFRPRPDGTYLSHCLVTSFVDVGPPYSHAEPGVAGRVGLSTFNWQPGTSVVVAYELTSKEQAVPRTALLVFTPW